MTKALLLEVEHWTAKSVLATPSLTWKRLASGGATATAACMDGEGVVGSTSFKKEWMDAILEMTSNEVAAVVMPTEPFGDPEILHENPLMRALPISISRLVRGHAPSVVWDGDVFAWECRLAGIYQIVQKNSQVRSVSMVTDFVVPNSRGVGVVEQDFRRALMSEVARR